MKVIIGLFLFLLLIVAVVLSLPFLVDLARYQDQYKPMIEGALNRKIQLQGIRLTIWPRIGARVQGFTVLDDPAFSSTPFASLTSLDVGVKFMPLLSGKVEVEEITLRGPVISVIKNTHGLTNLSTIGPKTGAAPAAPQTEPEQTGHPLQALALLAVDRVSIEDGHLAYRDLSTNPVTEYAVRDFDLKLDSVRLGDTPTVHLSGIVQPQNLPVKLEGSFGPLSETVEVDRYDLSLAVGKLAVGMKGALKKGQLDATVSSPLINSDDIPVHLPLKKPVQIRDLLIVAHAPYPLKQGVPATELADVSKLTLLVAMGNSQLHVQGTVLNGHVKIAVTSPSINTADVPVETGLQKPVEIKNLQAAAEFKGQEAHVSDLAFQLFEGQVKSQGALVTGSAKPPFNGKLTIQGLQVGSALKSLGPDSPLSLTGTAAANLTVTGQGFSMPDLTKTLEGPGHLEVKEGKIEGTNLIQEALGLLKVAGISLDPAKTTAFSTVETDFLIKQGIVHVQKLLMNSHDFQATGGGTVGFDQTLNLTMNMSLSPVLSQKIAESSPIGKLSLKDGRLTLPLLITGSVQRPSYGLDLRALTGKIQEKVEEKVKGTVKGLLEGTTKPEDLKQQSKELLKDLFGR